MDKRVNMGDFLKNGARILSDRDEGVKARNKAGLEESDKNGEKVILLIPKGEMWNITPSFFGGMFESSIKKYRDKFWDYYSFMYKDDTEISDELHEKMDYNYNYILERLD